MRSEAGTVTAYLKELPADRRAALEHLRALIERAAPKAKASMKYGLPSWDWNGPLFALTAQKHYLELYVAEADLVAARKKTLGDVEVGKSSIRFKRLADLNLESVAALLEAAAARRR